MVELDPLETAGIVAPVPAGTGMSTVGLLAAMPLLKPGIQALALTALVALSAYAYYSAPVPSIVSTSLSKKDTGSMEPEVVKRRTERWCKEASVNPAFPPGDEPDQAVSPTNQNKRSLSAQHTESSGPDQRGSEQSENSISATEWEFDWQSDTDVSFDDIGGMTDLKAELRAEIIKPLENPEKADNLGVSAPNVLFHGPPGTGKTYTAQALATELGLPFVKLSGSDIQSKWINESATKVNNLFAEAQQIAAREGGAVVFLDELDSVLKSRNGGGNAHEEDNKVVNEFLNHLEDTKEYNIVFIGATNRIESLDRAGIRSGRIDLKIHIGKPDTEGRKEILRTQLTDREHSLSQQEISELAAATDGAVPADLERAVNKAAKNVLLREGSTIQYADFL